MSKLHIWSGNFKSEQAFEKYLDQKEYLEAWAVYDHEPSTGNEEEDAEPNPELRCDFCKEVDLDTYDEDCIILKYYGKSTDIKTIAHDILVDEKELKALYEKHKINDFNSIIAYEGDVSEKSASNSKTVKYIGKLQQTSDEISSDNFEVHHLWIGENKLDKKNLLKRAEIDKEKVIKLHYYHTTKSEKLDEVLILQIEDYNIAEKMILKVDQLKILTSNSMLDLVTKGNVGIDGEKIGAILGMKYIGKFDSE